MINKVTDISAIIKDKIKNYNAKTNYSETGRVITIGDGIALVNGLDNVKNGEIVIFPNNVYGLALNLEEEVVGVALFGDFDSIVEGDIVKRSGQVISIKVGDELLGRVVDGLGNPIDGKGAFKSKKTSEVFKVAPGVLTRESINEPLETGILAIDSMIPIGKGQRELIIGDRQTGKTTIAIDTIINQKGKNVNCVYVAIGQKNSTVAQIVKKLEDHHAMEYTTVVIAGASELAPLQYVAPYTGITIAEEWMAQGKDVLIVYDDLSKHAIAYRTLSLLLRRPPGREAYPGDVFYLHSQLLERSAKVTKKYGGGSITALPIIETLQGDISAYIPTNVISITDGQIFTNENLFNTGQRPAVDVSFSVSRVGSAAQYPGVKKVSSSLKLKIAQYNEMQSFAQFGSDLDESTKKILKQGAKIYELLKQEQGFSISEVSQMAILLGVKEKVINPLPKEKVHKFRDKVIKFMENDPKGVSIALEIQNNNYALNEQIEEQILQVLVEKVAKIIKAIPNYDIHEHEPLPEKLKKYLPN
ncbi:F0F1 ATP synthase subunit alpha [Mycoplasmopsis hyopharyngis]|uniref:F0F1 ATP synthase subunit alpha n=1 Tax=Mycoplasmopsis hyopharyngis TaxID=29558 RepID=UPI003872FCA4